MTESSTTTEIQVVRQFLGALEALDVDAAVDLLADDVTYQNVPLPAARGKAAVEKQLRLLTRYGTGFEVVYDNVASDGAVVLTERTDVLVLGRLRAAFWVCGTFEVRNGKIELWRDRFDYVDVLLSFVRGGLKLLMEGSRRR
jgi:limonene-1,2-epoxide hydrolase